MTRARLVHLLDDVRPGGVVRALDLFDSAAIRNLFESAVEHIDPGAPIAPRLDADLIVLHFPPRWGRLSFLLSLRLRNPRARVIWVEHSYTRAWERAMVHDPARFHVVLRLAARLVDQVVCVSQAQAAWLREVTGLPEGAVAVIHPHAANPGLEQLEPPAFVPGATLRIGAYGRFSEQKGFDLLIGAHRRGLMPGSSLVIGGHGSDEPELRLLAGDSRAIRFVGEVSRVADFMARCDVIAVPSRWEPYGMAANEAREAGRPVLVAPVDGLPEQVGHAGLVIDFTRDAAIAEGFRRLRAADLPGMARSARLATSHCGPARAERWVSLLTRLLQAPPRRLLSNHRLRADPLSA